MKITYICHSSFLVELEDAYFLFDYYKGKLPKLDPDKKLFVFASHIHFDHYNKCIFDLAKGKSRIHYILSDDIPIGKLDSSLRVRIWHAGAHKCAEIDGCSVKTLRSTDEGVAFLINYGGKTIYHAGDLNLWHWEEEGKAYNEKMASDYCREIDLLQGRKIDVAFVPVDPRLEKAYTMGLDYFMRHTDTAYVFPMHFWGHYEIFSALLREPVVQDYRDRIVVIEGEDQSWTL